MAIPLLFERKKLASFSSFFVYVNVLPVADENFAVASCSSERIGLSLLCSPADYDCLPIKELLLVAPDLVDGANLICLPFIVVVLGLRNESDVSFMPCFFFASSSSRAFSTSLLTWGASWDKGSKVSEKNLNLVLIPEMFFKINF